MLMLQLIYAPFTSSPVTISLWEQPEGESFARKEGRR